jgi:putative tricarboxylic transport membrane protein
MRVHDAILGSLLIVVALLVAAIAWGFPSPSGAVYGPAFFPLLLSALLGLCGVALVGTGLRSASPLVQLGPAWRSPRSAINVLLVPGALVIYILLSGPLGFVPVSFAILSLLMVVYLRRPLAALALAGVTTALLYGLFDLAFGVHLPAGLLRGIL